MKKCIVLSMVAVAAFSAVAAFDVKSLQKAIDDASASGGGTVVVPKGKWETGPIALKNGVTLHLEKGAFLLGCTNTAVYRAAKLPALVHTAGATNVAITGEGTIDGRGGLMTTSFRPHLVNFRDCRNVRVEGVTLRCGGSWTLNPLRCDGVTIRNVKIWSHVNHCNDGIDVSSSNVLIENCDIDADDDALVFKTPMPDVRVENVKVRNCRLASSCNAIKFGTETHGKIRNVEIRDCTVAPTSAHGRFDWRMNTPGVTEYLTGLSGIAVECVDGGTLENVTVSGVTIDGYQTPVFVRLGCRRESLPGRPSSCMRNVLIENVRSTAPARSRIACSITGVKGLRPCGITLRNVDLAFPGGGTPSDHATPVPEVERSYPENRMFNAMPLPAYAFYVRHADGVKFENVRTSLAAADARPAVVIDDSQVEIGPDCAFQSPTGGARTVVTVSNGSSAEQMAQFWKSMDMGDAYFVRSERGRDAVPRPLVVQLGTSRKRPPEIALSHCRPRGWSLLAPFAKDVKGVLATIAKVRDGDGVVFLKGDDPFSAALALEVLAAEPKGFAAVSAISPASCPDGLEKVRGVDVDIVVAARNKKASAGFAAFNALCAEDRRIPSELANAIMKAGKAPAEHRFKGEDPDFPRKVRPLTFRRESASVRISVTDTVSVSCVRPSFERFAQVPTSLAKPPVRLILAGDSTMQHRSAKSKSGSWAEALSEHLRDGVEIVNCARGGRSTRTFAPDWTTNVLSRIRPGDWVLIQFGHNDMSKASDPKIDRQTDPDSEYSNNLRRFVADVRFKGGNPVLVTSITLYLYGKKDGKWTGRNPLSPWVESMKRLAAESHTPIIDLNAATFAAVRDAGREKAAEWYMISVDGKDRVHPTKAGADRFAKLFLNAVRETGNRAIELFRKPNQSTSTVSPMVGCKANCMPPLPAGAFTYAVIPDTQDYDGEGRHTKRGRKPGVGPTTNHKFDAVVDWLVANREKENILFVTHTGDITDMNNDPQWRFASNAMSRLDGNLPYSISPGNHDMKTDGDTSLFRRYFPASRFKGNSWYASAFPGYTNSNGRFVSGGAANTICLFEHGQEKFAVVTLECNAPDPVLAWAAKELEKYGDRRVIVATHQDIGSIKKENGRRIYNDLKKLAEEERAKYTPDMSILGRMEWHKCHGKEGNSGKAIWEKFTSRLKNAFLVVSGDQGMIDITRVDEKGRHGNMVHSLMQDTSEGYIRIFRFVPSEGKIYGYTVDPKRNGCLVHSFGVWRDSKWFNFELPYPPVTDAFDSCCRKGSESDATVSSCDPIAARKVDWKGVPNARDLGGLPGFGGRYVRRGRIYRTAGLNDNAKYRYPGTKKQMPKEKWTGPGKSRITPPVRELIVEKLGVKTDLDLRNEGETFKMTGSPLGEKVKWIRIKSSNYGGLAKDEGREAFAKCFKVFLDESNYPIVFHCIAGADRTGSLACILNGLLGVEKDLLYRDWQYTWTGKKNPSEVPVERWVGLMSVFDKFKGSTLNEKIENFVLSNGFSTKDIDKFRSLMLK